MKAVKWILISLAGLIVLILIFYAEEDWRGKRAWENCKRELEAKGEILDWNKLIPPPVPDDQNFFAAPKMQEWFVGRGKSELADRIQSENVDITTSVGADKNRIVTAEEAKEYLKWSDQFQPDFNLIREALKRPYARMDGDYAQPYQIPIPNFVSIRIVAQTLAQRTHCRLLLGQPDKALDELTLLNDSRRMLEAAPTGKSVTLVATMINVAVTGLYVNTIAEGFRLEAWREPQLTALQRQLEKIDLSLLVAQSFQQESAGMCYTVETAPLPKIFFTRNFLRIPRGWFYQNMVLIAQLDYENFKGFDLTNNTILPKQIEEARRQIIKISHKRRSPYTFLAAIVIPDYEKAWQTTAHNQTMVNEAQIACALERYHLAHGEYPGTLDMLVPQFIEKIPHDIIGGPPSQGSGATSQPLHYRATNDGKFLLYSVGWNEIDDGGRASPQNPSGGIDYSQGDWVWKN